MAFKVVAQERADGDYDVIAAFNIEMFECTEKQVEHYAQEAKEWLDSQDFNVVILDLSNVTDVIERFYIHGEEDDKG